MAFIGFGGWVYYYYFLIWATVTKLLKEDIFGFGKSFQILNDLIIAKHKFLILFISYFSEFLFGFIICLYLIYSEKAHIKKKNKYEKMENEINSNSNITNTSTNSEKNEENNKKKKNSKQELELSNDLVHNFINDDNISNKLASIIKKKSSEINKSNSTEKTIPKRFELIHNDIYDDIAENSFGLIILSSSLLIINDVIIKWIFSTNEIFDYFFLNILIMTLIFKYHYHEKIYSHQNLALVIILFISGSLFIACLFEEIDFSYDNKNKTIWEAFNENHYMVFIFIIIYFSSSLCACYGTIIQKRIMDYKYVSPYKIIFLKGVLGIIISFVIIIISTYVPCKENHIVDINIKSNKNINLNKNNISNYNIYNFNDDLSNETDNTEIDTSPPLFECADSFKNNTYFDNLFSYYYNISNLEDKKDKYLELFFSIPVYCILHFITNILLIFVNKLLSPIHCLIVDSLYRILHIPIQTLQDINVSNYSNYTEVFFYEFIIQPLSTKILRAIAYLVSLIGYCIYLEIIELKFCRLNYNIRKNIRKRAKSDGKARDKISNYSITSSERTSEERGEGTLKNSENGENNENNENNGNNENIEYNEKLEE